MSALGGGHGFGASHGAPPGSMRGMRGNDRKPPPLMDPARTRDRHRILSLFAPYRLRLAAVLGRSCSPPGLSMISPFLLRSVLDSALPHRDGTLLTELVLGMIGIAIATAAISVGRRISPT